MNRERIVKKVKKNRLSIGLRYRERLLDICNCLLFEACDICLIIWPVVALSSESEFLGCNCICSIAVNTIICIFVGYVLRRDIIFESFLNFNVQIEFQTNLQIKHNVI